SGTAPSSRPPSRPAPSPGPTACTSSSCAARSQVSPRWPHEFATCSCWHGGHPGHRRPNRPGRRSAVATPGAGGQRATVRERAMSIAEYDLVVRGGDVIDGSGLPRRRVDVGIRDGRVATLARLGGRTARAEIDATGMIVAPGIVDAHTHYDPQITFDPYATVSCFHGVTTVVAGNCGFSVAPVKPEDRDFLQGIFAQVENMDPIALSAIAWDEFETLREFMASRRGKVGVNLACSIVHSNLRRWVRGADATERTAADDEIARMRELIAEAMA